MKMNTASSSGSRTLPGNTITNPKEDLKGITTRSRTAYQGPTIPTTSSSMVEERKTETEFPILNFEPIVAPITEPVVALVSAPKPNQRPSILYPSRLHDQKFRDKANDQREKFFQIFEDLNFKISFADALILMPKYGPTIKTLLTNKDKLSELARTSLNEHCSAVLLKKLPEKPGDPGKFFIPCDFPGMAKFFALADLSASINLMPLSIKRALIDVFVGELTLRVGKKAITFNLDQTSRYTAKYNDMTANRIEVIDMACEEYSQDVLGFSDVIASGNPTPYYDPIVSTTSPTLTPFGESDFLLEEKLRDKANDQREKFFQIFKDLNFNISFVDALILMPKFSPSIKSLLTNKDKLCELARTPLNEHCLAVLLKKLPEKLGDPGKCLIPCDFPRMAECLALADLDASINLMPLSVWNKLSLSELTPTLMTLEIADRLISRPIGVAEDVYVKVGKFHFPGDFVVVDFDVDPQVPLILGRSFLKTGRALIDVFEGELTLRVGKEAITLNLDQTSRYSANYNDMTANRIDVIDMACVEYSQEVLGFSDVIASEVDAFLALEDDPTSPEVDQSYVDTEGDILLLEAFLNDDPSLTPPNQGNYLPQVRKELKICEAKTDKSSIDEPLEVELKDLPPHLEYAFLEGDNKLPVIIAKI
nr:reverse transcriptase domain-containing protein [Tanacetum cinerariifolium]